VELLRPDIWLGRTRPACSGWDHAGNGMHECRVNGSSVMGNHCGGHGLKPARTGVLLHRMYGWDRRGKITAADTAEAPALKMPARWSSLQMRDAGETGGMQSRQDGSQGGRCNAKKVSAAGGRGTRGGTPNKYLRAKNVQVEIFYSSVVLGIACCRPCRFQLPLPRRAHRRPACAR